MKNPLTPAGIEPATFRFVTQHLNHCDTAVPTEKKEKKFLLVFLTYNSCLIPTRPHFLIPIVYICVCVCVCLCLYKGTAIPLQAWTGPEGSRKIEAPGFLVSRHMKVARLSALCSDRLYSPGNIPGTHFC